MRHIVGATGGIRDHVGQFRDIIVEAGYLLEGGPRDVLYHPIREMFRPLDGVAKEEMERAE